MSQYTSVHVLLDVEIFYDSLNDQVSVGHNSLQIWAVRDQGQGIGHKLACCLKITVRFINFQVHTVRKLEKRYAKMFLYNKSCDE